MGSRESIEARAGSEIGPPAGAHDTPPELADRLARRLLGARSPGVASRPILDPACGTGELLLAAWRVGKERGLRPQDLHGFESDPARARTARRRLRAELGEEVGRAVARRIRCVDALASETPWPGRAAVLANPPWVSFSGRQASRHPSREHLAGRQGWPSLHGAFLERIARHVADVRSHAALLLPASLCQLDRYGPTRARVSALATPRVPAEELGEDVFPGVVEPAVILELTHGPSTANAAPWPTADPIRGLERAIVERLERFPPLAPSCYGDIGVHTGNSARQLLRQRTGAAMEGPGIREGRDLTAFHLGAPRLTLETRLERSAARRFRFASLERYRAVPVLLRQTADRPIAARHHAPTYFRNTLLACTPPAELDPAFVVGVLNASILARWHRASFADARQRTFPQVKLSHLRRAPFPILARAESPALHDELVRVVHELERLADATEVEPLESHRPRLDALVDEAFDARAPGPRAGPR